MTRTKQPHALNYFDLSFSKWTRNKGSCFPCGALIDTCISKCSRTHYKSINGRYYSFSAILPIKREYSRAK